MAISKIKIGNTEHEIETTIANVDGLQAIIDALTARIAALEASIGFVATESEM